jgi:hypothetical protein
MSMENIRETEATTTAQPAESSERRSFMKSLVTGAVAAGGLAAVTMVETASAQSGCTTAFTAEELKQLTSAVQAYGGRLVEYFPCGIPAPDSVWGTATIRPDLAGAMIQALLKLDRFRLRLEVFPYGIPYPDLVNVQFRTPGTANGL